MQWWPTCKTPHSGSHKAASLLMPHCYQLDLACPQGLHQVNVLLACPRRQSCEMLSYSIRQMILQLISGIKDALCNHGLHLPMDMPAIALFRSGVLLGMQCAARTTKTTEILPGSAKIYSTPSFSRAATSRSDVFIGLPKTVAILYRISRSSITTSYK